MENLIRSKEEQIRKQEAEIARKTHEIQNSPSHTDLMGYFLDLQHLPKQQHE